MALGDINEQPLFISTAIHHLHFREADTFFIAGRGGDAGDHHELDQLLTLQRQLAPLRFFVPVFAGGYVFVREGLEELLCL